MFPQRPTQQIIHAVGMSFQVSYSQFAVMPCLHHRHTRRDPPYRGGRQKHWIKMLRGGADGDGCGTLGALSNDTNGAPMS